jgi:hypothetical protein
VTITNPLPGSPEWVQASATSPINPSRAPQRAYFSEEKIIAIDGTNSSVDAGGCMKPFDPAASIPMRNPETGELTGETVLQAELYTILYSLYMQTALARDAA